jgi:adenine-specific DNA-methyltransferase
MKHKVYIGDNLRVMQTNKDFDQYGGKVSVIYIDPPYNTKTKKSYNDKQAREEWLEFMKARLILGRYYLKEDGVIFISIDDNEYAYLKVLCDEVFGEKNCLGTFITKQSQRSNSKHINTVHEYILAYARNKKKCPEFKVKRTDTPEGKKNFDAVSTYGVFSIATNPTFEDALKDYRRWLVNFCKANDLSWLRNYNYIDEVGTPYFATDLSTPGKPRTVDIPEIGLHLDPLPTRGWSSDEKFKELYKAGRLIFRDGRPYAIHYLEEAEDSAPSILDFYSRQGNEDMKRLGLDGIFDTPKPVNMLKYLLRITGVSEGPVLDFFAGSGSFCQAVEEVNKEDGKNLQCLLIQLDEDIELKSEAFERCLELGIEPNIPAVLEARLKKVGCDYEILK